MHRLTLLTLAAVCLACARDDGPSKVSAPLSAPDQANYSASNESFDGDGGRLNVDDAYATMVVTHAHSVFRECDARGVHYAESRNVFTGQSTGDPRLSGRFEFEMLYDLLSFAKFNGPDIARITVRDPASGKVKAEGIASSWGAEDWLRGTIVGVVRDQSDGGRWLANFRIHFTSPGAVIDIGGGTTPANQPAAGIYSGNCRGASWQTSDWDAGGASPQALSAATSSAAWLRRGF